MACTTLSVMIMGSALYTLFGEADDDDASKAAFTMPECTGPCSQPSADYSRNKFAIPENITSYAFKSMLDEDEKEECDEEFTYNDDNDEYYHMLDDGSLIPLVRDGESYEEEDFKIQ